MFYSKIKTELWKMQGSACQATVLTAQDVRMAVESNPGPSMSFEHFKFVNSIYLFHSSQTANDFYLLGQYFGIA